MIEHAPQKERSLIIVNSCRTVRTDVGEITKFNLVNNGATRTIYSHIESDYGLENVLKKVEKAKIWAKNPIMVKLLESEHLTPEEYIKKEGSSYLEALKANKNKDISEFREDLLFPLIKQTALEELFNSNPPSI